MAKRRGRHQSTDKSGSQTITRLEKIAGVTAVVIGRSYGGKSISRGNAAGDFKLQSQVQCGFKGILQTSKGIQEIYVHVDGDREAAAARIREAFPG